jgi:hypothetical protein
MVIGWEAGLMPGTYEELNAIARKAWRPSPQSEFIEELMANAEAGLCQIYQPAMQELLKRVLRPVDLPATHTIEGEPLKPLLAHVGPSGNFNVPVVVAPGGVPGTPDILAITRDVVRSG